jgi:hypothetical protein
MQNLPLELYRPVIGELDRRTLFQLLLVSRRFQAEAERRIYQTVSLCGPLSLIEDGCKRLLAKPHLFPYVLWLFIEEPGWSTHSILQPLRFQGRLSAVLEGLSNLIGLDISVDEKHKSWRVCGSLFTNVQFQLRFLRCPFDLDADFALFLENQPKIYEFVWRPWSRLNHCDLTPNTLPILTILELRWSVDRIIADQLISGKTIAHLTWDRFDEDLELLVQQLRNLPLRTLSFHWTSLDSLLRPPNYNLFPRLEFLASPRFETAEVGLSQIFLRCFHIALTTYCASEECRSCGPSSHRAPISAGALFG